jgi:serine/threonine protein kinase
LSDRDKEFLSEEIQIVRLISHPNVVQMKESYETDKYLYIVMEQVNGGELFEHIRTYDLDEKEVALIMN